MSVLFVILGERLAPRTHNLVQGLGVLGSVDDVVLVSPGLLTVPVARTELRSQAGRIRDEGEQYCQQQTNK